MSGILAANRSAVAAARAFYCDALGGRQLRSTSGGGTGELCFHVGGTVITTGPVTRHGPITLFVDDVVAVAERCWDAGFTVRVRESAEATTVAVIDPFDLEMELVSSNDHACAASVVAQAARPITHGARRRGARRAALNA